MTSWNVLLRPVVALRRRSSTGSDLEQLHPVVNAGLRAIVTAERYLPVGRLPGVTLLVRARKPVRAGVATGPGQAVVGHEVGRSGLQLRRTAARRTHRAGPGRAAAPRRTPATMTMVEVQPGDGVVPRAAATSA